MKSPADNIDRIAALEAEVAQLRAQVLALVAMESLAKELAPAALRVHPTLPIVAAADWSFVQFRDSGPGFSLTSHSQQTIIARLWRDSLSPSNIGSTAQDLARAVGSDDVRFNVKKCFCPSGGRRRHRRENPAWRALIEQVEDRYFLAARNPQRIRRASTAA